MLCSGPICKDEGICDATSNDRLDQSTNTMMKWVDVTGLRKMAPTEIGRFCAVWGQKMASAKSCRKSFRKRIRKMSRKRWPQRENPRTSAKDVRGFVQWRWSTWG